MRKAFFLDLLVGIIFVLFLLAIPKMAGQIPTFSSAPVVVVKDPPDPRPDNPEQLRQACLQAITHDNQLGVQIYKLKQDPHTWSVKNNLKKLLKQKHNFQKQIEQNCR